MSTATKFVTSYPNIAWDGISIALIGPNELRRTAAARVLAEYSGIQLTEYSRYPDSLHELPQLIDRRYDVLLVDLDSDIENALHITESISAYGKEIVMVYSSQNDPDLVVRAMRAGAREFLLVPFKPGDMEEALVRASVRRPKVVTRTIRVGRVYLFVGAKGGVGVTSIACNFAVALAEARGHKTVLIDLNLPFGDAALNLGLSPSFSVVRAIEDSDRLDASYFSKLLVEHSSGLRLLASPDRFINIQPNPAAIEKIIAIARHEFDDVVIDIGSNFELLTAALNQELSKIYLVTQAGLPELRNANRLIREALHESTNKLEIVLNRDRSRTVGIEEKHIQDALTRPVNWRIPNDHARMRKMHIKAAPLVSSGNDVGNSIRAMANAAETERLVRNRDDIRSSAKKLVR